MKKVLLVLGVAIMTLTSCSKDDQDTRNLHEEQLPDLSVKGLFVAEMSGVVYQAGGYEYNIEAAGLDFPQSTTKNGTQVSSYLDLGFTCVEYTGDFTVSNLTPTSLKLSGSGSNYLNITYISTTSLRLSGIIDGVSLSGTLAAYNGPAISVCAGKSGKSTSQTLFGDNGSIN